MKEEEEEERMERIFRYLEDRNEHEGGRPINAPELVAARRDFMRQPRVQIMEGSMDNSSRPNFGVLHQREREQQSRLAENEPFLEVPDEDTGYIYLAQ